MAKESAGLLMFRRNSELEFLLCHPGGPFWKSKNAGAWTIPKGEIEEGEDPLAAAQREFQEEIGIKPQGRFVPLTPVRQKGGKLVRAWAFEGDCEPTECFSIMCKMEWPPKSGRVIEFPEIDRAQFFDFESAMERINPAQLSFLRELVEQVGYR